MADLLKRVVKTAFNQFGFDVHKIRPNKDFWTNPPSSKKHTNVFPNATYSPWLDDIEFLRTYSRISDHTLVDMYRCYELWMLAKQTSHVDGDILEVGVWRGGTGAILAKAVKDFGSKKVYLADTFAGVVKAGINDTLYKNGEHSDTSIETVQKLTESLALDNIEVLQGVFPDDTQYRVNGKIALLHCDVDAYASSKDVVEWCLPRLSLGAILVFDDYGFSGCEGVTSYCEELRNNQAFCFIHNLNGHAVFIKLK
jgi:O-methyltransferase